MDSQENNQEGHIPITESIESSNEIFFKLLETNKLKNALTSLEPYVHKSIYHCGLKAMALTLIAVSTLDKDDIEKASKATDILTKTCNRYRRTGFILSIMKLVKTPNYRKYSDLELHAELLYAYSIALNAGIFAINTYNIYGLIKVVYRLQKFIANFQSCKIINKLDINWESEVSRTNFEAGVRFTNGLCHLAISKIPPKLLKIVNFLGYRGIETVGFTQINKVAALNTGFNSQLARMFLLAYWLYIEPHGCLGPTNTELCLEVLNKELAKYPKSVIYLGGVAKYEQINGRIDKALEVYEFLIKNSDRRAHKAIRMEMLFSYALKCMWSECIKLAELVREESVHSPALSSYIEGVFRYVKAVDDNDSDMKEKASKLFESVPSLRIRHLGKTITPEKVAVLNSEKYFKNEKCLNLPEVEILYQLNYLAFIKGDQTLTNQFLERIEKQLDSYKHDKFESDYLDNYLTTSFYKGVLLKLKGSFKEAKDCFKAVLQEESRIGREFSIPPQAMLELGLSEVELNNKEEAEKWLNKCISDYSGYTNENYVLIRAYAGLRLIGVDTDKRREDELKMKEYTNEWLKELDVNQDNYTKIIDNEARSFEVK